MVEDAKDTNGERCASNKKRSQSQKSIETRKMMERQSEDKRRTWFLDLPYIQNGREAIPAESVKNDRTGLMASPTKHLVRCGIFLRRRQ